MSDIQDKYIADTLRRDYLDYIDGVISKKDMKKYLEDYFECFEVWGRLNHCLYVFGVIILYEVSTKIWELFL